MHVCCLIVMTLTDGGLELAQDFALICNRFYDIIRKVSNDGKTLGVYPIIRLVWRRNEMTVIAQTWQTLDRSPYAVSKCYTFTFRFYTALSFITDLGFDPSLFDVLRAANLYAFCHLCRPYDS
jgi:hypothetical protein